MDWEKIVYGPIYSPHLKYYWFEGSHTGKYSSLEMTYRFLSKFIV